MTQLGGVATDVLTRSGDPNQDQLHAAGDPQNPASWKRAPLPWGQPIPSQPQNVPQWLLDSAKKAYNAIAVGDPRVAPMAMPGSPQAAAGAPLTKVMEGGKPKMVFHGTPEDFANFNPRLANPRALYGPGHYFTDNPKVASGYATQNWSDHARDALFRMEHARSQGDYYRDLLARGRPRTPWTPNERIALTPQEIAHYKTELLGIQQIERAHAESLLRQLGAAPPDVLGQANVRPAYLDITKPVDMDAPKAMDWIERARQRFGRTGTTRSELKAADTNQDAYEIMNRLGIRKPQLTEAMREEGYDAITHVGGGRTGGDPHQVWIAFDPSQIVNPFKYLAQQAMRKDPATIARNGGATYQGSTQIGGNTYHEFFDPVTRGNFTLKGDVTPEAFTQRLNELHKSFGVKK